MPKFEAVDSCYHIWCRGLTEEARLNGLKASDAAARLVKEGFLDIQHMSKFRFGNSANIFTIGSCFAINITRALLKNGINVIRPNFIAPDERPASLLLTKYNTYSMLAEIEAAFGRRTIPENGLVELQEGLYWDPQLHHPKLLDYQSATEIRNNVIAHYQRLAEADVCIITLGLTEMWWDVENDLPLNAGPIDWRHAKKTGRFEFRNPTYHEIEENTKRTCELIREVSGADIILTISPVPLQRTFTGKDIIVANHYSKSALRAAAEACAFTFDYVDYFPAYEMVTYSDRALAWEHDQRHVTNNMVDHVIGKFTSLYVA